MSLRLRLGLWYGALTAAIVLLVSVVTYAAHTRALYSHLDEALVAAAQSAQVGGEVGELGVSVPAHVALWIQDAGGRVLAATPNADAAPHFEPAAVLARPASAPVDGRVRFITPYGEIDPLSGAFGVIDGGRGRWRTYVVPLARPRPPGGGSAALPLAVGSDVIVAAAPLAPLDDSVEEFRRLEPALVGGAALAALVAGSLLAGRALRPVAALTRTAHAIARSRVASQRVPVSSRRDELGELAATFNEMLESLEALARQQQRFVADASHELRAPLTAIQANLELLAWSELPDAERREVVEEARLETLRLSRLVADLLALARADAGVPLRRERVELDRIALEVLGDVRERAAGREIRVGELHQVALDGDAERLRQVIHNLLDNAVRYTPAGGWVTLALRQTGGAAELRISDTGIGIAPSDLARVFERFYRGDPARARDPGGTGLGLAIARWIVEAHNGRIALESEPGAGTTATVWLPLSHGAPAGPPPPAPDEAAGRRTLSLG